MENYDDLSLYSSILEEIEGAKKFVEDGGINCIPNPFPNFRRKFPGIRKKTYYIITGATKSAKTQFLNYFFIITPILYYMENPDKLRPKILYVPLEETKEEIAMRFYSYVLYLLSKGKYMLNSEDLLSVNADKVLPQEVLDLMKSEEFKKYAKVYEECVTFITDVRHPTGILKRIEEYFASSGHIETTSKEVVYTDSMNQVHKETVNTKHYIPNNPNEYVICITDHAGLLSQETEKIDERRRERLTLKATIEKLSDYYRYLRDTYEAIPVLVMQQNSETTNLEAIKEERIRPTKDGLKDSKRPGEDCTVLIGITNPHSFGLTKYIEYPISRLKDYFRLVEIVLNRKGRANQLCPLFFDGSVNMFMELPPPEDKRGLEKYCEYVEKATKPKTSTIMMFVGRVKHIFKNIT
jgi:hypothetical protein